MPGRLGRSEKLNINLIRKLLRDATETVGRRTSWDRIKDGDGLKRTPAPKRPRTAAPQEWITLYMRVMTPRDLDLADPKARFVVRCWDGMDGCWADCTGRVGAKRALQVWMERTKDGTEKIGFNDLDYYRIFPANTKMHWSGDNEMFR